MRFRFVINDRQADLIFILRQRYSLPPEQHLDVCPAGERFTKKPLEFRLNNYQSCYPTEREWRPWRREDLDKIAGYTAEFGAGVMTANAFDRCG